MMNKEIVLLGSGESLLDLTKEEKDFIKNCKVVIALNKYLAFYQVLGIKPTHLYYVDTHGNSFPFLKFTFEVCKKNKLRDIYFVLNEEIKGKIFMTNFARIIKEMKETICMLNLRTFISKNEFKKFAIRFLYILRNADTLIIPKGNKTEFIKRTLWLDAKSWAKSFNEPLFHYRTSFVSALNYISIKYPQSHIHLVGTDFNSGKYFFQKEIEAMNNVAWKDQTSDLTINNGAHFAIQDYNGTNLYDKMDYIIKKLTETGNSMSSPNINGDLVLKKFVEFKELK